MVRNPVVRPVIGADFLSQIPAAFLVFASLRLLGKLLLAKDLIELLSERVQRRLFILGLLSELLGNARDS